MEDIITGVRGEIVKRCGKIVDDQREETDHVIENKIRVVAVLRETIKLAENSNHVLNRSFGPSASAEGGAPLIGTK